ncbi:MAG: hypothetical protein M0019_04560 [Actinomycetota bacterium]|nr:hypothetical protein [Actinomycetota bacterium]
MFGSDFSMPSHWQPSSKAPNGLDVVVVDIDGVLADASKRQHYLENRPKDWQLFFAASAEDEVIEEVKRLLELLNESVTVVLLTGRPTSIADLTIEWLNRNAIRWNLLISRPTGDYTLATKFKEYETSRLLELGARIHLCIDDDPNNIEMYRKLGLPSLYVHSGYY